MSTNCLGRFCGSFLVATAAVAAASSAQNIYWTGAVDAVWENPGSANWTNSVGAACTYANGDNCYISDAAFAESKFLGIGKNTLRPNSVVFDIADELEFCYNGWGGLRDTTGSFTKRGSGTLIISRTSEQYRNDMRCGMLIEAGKVVVKGCDARFQREILGAMEYNPTFTVESGAELRLCGRSQLSNISSMQDVSEEPTEDSRWALGGKVVLDGGTLAIETSPDKESSANAMRELTFNNGGQFKVQSVKVQSVTKDCKGESSLDYGILRVIDKVTVAGNARPTISVDTYSKQKWMMEPMKPVEFAVADITGDARADFAIPMRIADINCTGQKYPRGAFVKTGAGTIQFTNRDSAWKGDFWINEGTLLVSNPEGTTYSSGAHTCKGATSYLGDLTDPDRSLTVAGSGTLLLEQRCLLWDVTYAPSATSPALLKTPIVFADGGKLKLTNDATPNTFGPLVFDDGSFEYAGGRQGIEDMIGVWGEVKITGSSVMHWDRCTRGNWYLFDEDADGNNITSFNVDDINGTADHDFDFGLALTQPLTFAGTGKTCGFDKTGAGTMRLTANLEGLTCLPKGATERLYYGFNGEARIKAGTLQVDGFMSSNKFTVASGAYISGTGRVNRVTLASGAGFAVRLGQAKPLKVLGDLSVPRTGNVELIVPNSSAEEKHRVDFAQIGGMISSAAGLEDPFAEWSVTVNGHPANGRIVRKENNILTCVVGKGLAIIVR